MQYYSIIACLIICSIQSITLASNPQKTSRVVIYNNHKVTQSVTANSTEYDRNTNSNKYPGHTKNETTSHSVDLNMAPKAPSMPESDFEQDESAIFIDNAHAINQISIQSTTHSRSYEPELPELSTNAPASWASPSWLAALMPPIIYQSTAIQIFFGSIGLSYAALMAKLLHAGHLVFTKNNTWSSWKISTPIETMHAQEKQFAQELFAAMQTKYINAPVNANFLSPLVYFMNDINAELTQLNSFISLHTTIDRFNVTFMFPKQDEALAFANEKIRRLEYFKTVIINWVGEYKV